MSGKLTQRAYAATQMRVLRWEKQGCTEYGPGQRYLGAFFSHTSPLPEGVSFLAAQMHPKLPLHRPPAPIVKQASLWGALPLYLISSIPDFI